MMADRQSNPRTSFAMYSVGNYMYVLHEESTDKVTDNLKNGECKTVQCLWLILMPWSPIFSANTRALITFYILSKNQPGWPFNVWFFVILESNFHPD